MPATVELRTVTADEDGMRLDRWFRSHYPGLAFSHLQKLCRTGQVRLDGMRVKTSDRVSRGQTVRVPPVTIEADAGARPQPKPARADDATFLRAILLHEDRDVFVFNKPTGLAVQGGSGTRRHIDGMLAALAGKDGQKPRLVHRLDKDTSGVLVVARTRKSASELAAAFRARSTRKIYWALVKGVPKPRQGRISTFLTKAAGPEGERMRIARHGEEDAAHALTRYSVVDQAGQSLAWLTLRPVSGRMHQLRVHCSHIGHPIVGDPKYFEARDWELPGGIQNRLHLHARRIVIPHPRGGTLDVTAPLPPHMVQSWNLLGFDASAYDPEKVEPGEE